MKILLILLLLSSCAHNRKLIEPNKKLEKKMCEDIQYTKKMYDCMKSFADKGFDSDGLVKICNEIYKRRK